MKSDVRAYVQRNFVRRTFDLYLQEVRPNGQVALPEPVMMRVYENADTAIIDTPPMLAMSETTAQTMMDELWKCGIRPTEESGLGAIHATERHLDDMRKIAFDLLQVRGVQ